jgi:AcrR family transcriptional regulator
MPKVSDQHRERRRDQILNAALRCFAARGFQRTSMADIITESGLSAGAIYGHFGSKQEIMLSVAKRVLINRMSEFAGRIEGGGELPPPSAMLGMLMSGLSNEIHDVRVLVQLWGEAVTEPEMSELIGTIFGQVRGVMGPYLTRWAVEHRGMSRDAAAAWASDMLLVFMGMAQGYILESALLPEFDPDAYLRGVGSLLDGTP